jgi:ribosomal protein RSM22 (predicted rRNA methylase)
MASRLPERLYQAIQARFDRVPLRTLKAGYQLLSRDYRSRTVSLQEREDLEGGARASGHVPAGYTDTEGRGLAYLAARLPATYAAVQSALRQVPDAALEGASSVLDLGAGPGTATFALFERWPSLQQAILLERDKAMLAQSQALAEAFPELKLSIRELDFVTALDKAEAQDLVVMAFALSEVEEAVQGAFIEALWAKAKQGLLIVDPGTPDTSRRLQAVRSQLINMGAHLIAPCPQSGACPLLTLSAPPKRKGQAKARPENAIAPWCHFNVRLERRGLHRLVKGGELGYEDEKFSYLYFSRRSLPPAAPMRLLSDPHRVSRHINLDVCNAKGEREAIFLNRRDTPYHLRHAARQLEWGFAWDPDKVPVQEGDDDNE